ncbi:hypothetical protein H8356DRAFT_503483 [Neocallimastix lanati (nom. inval.)]|nr:hypothetical protein H8356DRAFT_503483 [Neocallimastix sp. JGI-2020a]
MSELQQIPEAQASIASPENLKNFLIRIATYRTVKDHEESTYPIQKRNSNNPGYQNSNYENENESFRDDNQNTRTNFNKDYNYNDDDDDYHHINDIKSYYNEEEDLLELMLSMNTNVNGNADINTTNSNTLIPIPILYNGWNYGYRMTTNNTISSITNFAVNSLSIKENFQTLIQIYCFILLIIILLF